MLWLGFNTFLIISVCSILYFTLQGTLSKFSGKTAQKILIKYR